MNLDLEVQIVFAFSVFICVHLCSKASLVRNSLWLALMAAFAAPALAEVSATDAWVRGTVPAQKSTGAFMTLHSTDYARIVEVRTPVAKAAEIHASEMQGGVMQMHAMEDFLLLPGKSVELKPGSYHIMLMGLAKPLAAGDTVPLTLVIEEAKGRRRTLEVRAEVRPLAK